MSQNFFLCSKHKIVNSKFFLKKKIRKLVKSPKIHNESFLNVFSIHSVNRIHHAIHVFILVLFCVSV